MPEKRTVEHARADLRSGKSPGTAAGEFVKEEMEHIQEGKHGARSRKQAIAIGLSKARRAGVRLGPPSRGSSTARTRKSAAADARAARRGTRKAPSPRRSKASLAALKREGRPKLSGAGSGASASARRGARTRARHAGATRRGRSGPRGQ